jgi:anti-sigma B factor antagonist
VELTLEVQCRDDKPILSCQGHLICGDEADALLAAISRLLATSEQITLDLRDLRKMDCAGLGAIVAAVNVAHQRGRSVELCAVPPRIRRMINLAGLEGIFCVSERPAEAAA